jgi:predicted dehydrogenase
MQSKLERKLGIGIIGCGIISAAHIKGYLALGADCEIKAVADVAFDKARQTAASIGDGVAAYADYNDMLAREDIDVISICTPPFLHKDPAVAAARAGKHVLCEKPFAPSLQDCDAMIAEAKARGKKIAVVFQYRYRQDFRQVRRILQSGLMGPLVFAQMNARYFRGDHYYDIPWRGKFATECGGVTMNHAIHPLDIFLWLLGDVESVQAQTHTVAHCIEVEDLSMATLKFSDGTQAQINCTLNSVKNDISMVFSGKYKSVELSGAQAIVPLQLHAISESDTGAVSKDEAGLLALQELAAQVGAGTKDHTGPISDLFCAIRGDTEPEVSGVEGRKTIEVITAIYKSATLGVPVSLPLKPDDPWYTTAGIMNNVKKSPLVVV